MPRLQRANQAVTTLAVDITTTGQTSWTVVDSSSFPDAGPFVILINEEYMEVGTITKGTHTFSDVLRGEEGSAAATHTSGDSVRHVFSAKAHGELEDQANKGEANGYAPLDASSEVPVANLPDMGLDHFEGNREPDADGQVVHQLVVDGADTDIGIALTPKGTGAITAHVPDGAAAGGNARGSNAVDLQTDRSANTEVASGAYSVVGGGNRNTADKQYATVAGGFANDASGDYVTVGGGHSNDASQNYATVSGGNFNTASGNYTTVAGGAHNDASGAESTIGGGHTNTASATNTTVVGGRNGSAYLVGMEAYANGRFAADGDAQRSDLIARRQTTNATPTELSLLSASLSRMVLPTGRVWRLRADVVAKQTAGTAGTVGDVYSVTIIATIKHIGGTTSLVGAPVYENEMRDAGLAGVDVTVVTPQWFDAFKIEVTGEANKTIRWVSHVQIVEVGS